MWPGNARAYQWGISFKVHELCHALGVCSLFILLTSCSGGGENPTAIVGGSGGGSGGGTGGGAASVALGSGPITGFGSVHLSDKKYETTGDTKFEVHGQTGKSQNDLRLGMQVKIQATSSGNQLTATSIAQEDTVEGPVQFIAADGLSLVVLGQTVLVDNNTVFDNSIPGQTINDLAVDNLVEVSGLVQGDGQIAANFIERKVAPADFEVHGIIKNHNATAQTFQIGNLTVNYAGGTIINDMPVPAGSNWNQLAVEVKGTAFTPTAPPPSANSGGTLTASKVEPDGLPANDAAETEIEGFVTKLGSSLGNFFIGNAEVRTGANTIFRGGTVDEIIVGLKVEVEGALSNGILTASKVSFQESIRLESNVATSNLGAGTFTLANLPGITVQVNSQTKFKGQGSPTNPPQSLSDVPVNSHVRVRGRPGTGNTVIATEVEVKDIQPKDDVVLQGTVQSVAAPNLTILGVTVNTTNFGFPDFQGVDDTAIGREAFFNQVKVGSLVKAKGRLNGSTVTWREIEFEGED